MFNDWYVLDGKEVVKAESLEVLTEFLKDNSNKTVKQEHVGNVLVSTVFLGDNRGDFSYPIETLYILTPEQIRLNNIRDNLLKKRTSLDLEIVDIEEKIEMLWSKNG